MSRDTSCHIPLFPQRSKQSTGRLSLDDLLIKPVQRIPRYVLFIKDLLKHTSSSHPDHAPLQQALSELTGLAERVNESEREMARINQQRDLLASVDGLALVGNGCLALVGNGCLALVGNGLALVGNGLALVGNGCLALVGNGLALVGNDQAGNYGGYIQCS